MSSSEGKKTARKNIQNGLPSSVRWSGVERFFRNDIANYASERERAAYRAGLSMAFGICDNVGAEYPNKKQSKLREVAKLCGDKIEMFYNEARRSPSLLSPSETEES